MPLSNSYYFPAALYLFTVSVLAGFVGQLFVRKLLRILGRASIIVFILSGVIFASALTMGKPNQFQLQYKKSLKKVSETNTDTYDYVFFQG